MPNAALRPCASPGCHVLVKSGYCAKHKRSDAVPVSNDRKVRNRLYSNNTWKTRRRVQLASQPWCEDCLTRGIYTPATDVHHVDRHAGDSLVFATSPLQSLCHACHSKHTAQEQGIQQGEGPSKSFTRGSTSGGGQRREKLSPMEAD